MPMTLYGHQSANPLREAISILSGKLHKIYVCSSFGSVPDNPTQALHGLAPISILSGKLHKIYVCSSFGSVPDNPTYGIFLLLIRVTGGGGPTQGFYLEQYSS